MADPLVWFLEGVEPAGLLIWFVLHIFNAMGVTERCAQGVIRAMEEYGIPIDHIAGSPSLCIRYFEGN